MKPPCRGGDETGEFCPVEGCGPGDAKIPLVAECFAFFCLSEVLQDLALRGGAVFGVFPAVTIVYSSSSCPIARPRRTAGSGFHDAVFVEVAARNTWAAIRRPASVKRGMSWCRSSAAGQVGQISIACCRRASATWGSAGRWCAREWPEAGRGGRPGPVRCAVAMGRPAGAVRGSTGRSGRRWRGFRAGCSRRLRV